MFIDLFPQGLTAYKDKIIMFIMNNLKTNYQKNLIVNYFNSIRECFIGES